MTSMESNLLQTIKNQWGFSGSLSSLMGYQDKNFKLISTTGSSYIVKLSVLPSERDFVLAQNKILLELNDARFPMPLRTQDGHGHVDFGTDEGGCVLRLFPFIEGEFLADVNPGPELYKDLGLLLGQLNKKLLHHLNPVLQCQSHEWDLARFQELRGLLAAISDPAVRRLVHFFLMKHREEVVPIFANLPKGLIHQDANDYNILLQSDPSGSYKINGLIDFGDMVYGARIHELGIALAYALMGKKALKDLSREMVLGYHETYALTQSEIHVLYYLTAARLCTTILHASKKATEQSESEYHQVSLKPAVDLLHEWIKINPFDFEESLLSACELRDNSRGVNSTKEKIKQRQRFLSNALSLSYQEPIELLGSALQYLYAADGKTYLDCVNNIPHVGHAHPVVVEAGQKQMARLNTNTRYVYDSLLAYAELLLSYLPDSLSKVFFVNSGSAATDLAVRLAKQHTQSDHFYVLEHAYHGNTSTAIALSPYKFNRKGGFGKPDKTSILSFDAETFHWNQQPAALFAESIPGCGGQVLLDTKFIQGAVSSIRQQGGLYIADEVQTGFGRVGQFFWGFELYDIIPDMVILGKPMANGHPMAAVVCTQEIAASFETGMEFFSSFGGNPVSCEIAKSVLEVIKAEQLQGHALKLGHFLLTTLKELQDQHNKHYSWNTKPKTKDNPSPHFISEVRGTGLFLGIEFVKNLETQEPDPETASWLVNQMKNKGFLLSTDGPYENVIKIKPPMCFSHQNAEELVKELRLSLKELS